MLSFLEDKEILYERMLMRDPTLDGHLFVCVLTTGIYCRPVCKARPPLRKNIRFLPTAAAAEKQGFRPCLRCRPETAPFCSAWNGTKTTVERALRLIDDGALDGGSVEALCERLGVGPRHLRRLFEDQVGASPNQVAKTRRVQRAKVLLSDTKMPVNDIALEAGFSTPRRMHAAFVGLYGRAPSSFRKSKSKGAFTYV